MFRIKRDTKKRCNSGYNVKMRTSIIFCKIRDITLVEHEMDVQIHFPISRIKMILKEDESCKLIVRKEAYFYIQKAAV